MEIAASKRSMSVEWSSPALVAEGLMEISGIDFLRQIIAAKRPPAPIQSLVGFDLIEAADGKAVFSFRPDECHFNPIGSVHGGIAGLLLDSAMGASVHSKLQAGQAYTTLEYKVNLTRPIVAGSGTLHAEGSVVNFGRKVATVEARLEDLNGKLYAHATSTCLIIGES